MTSLHAYVNTSFIITLCFTHAIMMSHTFNNGTAGATLFASKKLRNLQ